MKCLINLFSDAQLNFNEWQHGKNYLASVAEIAKLWQTKKLGFHVEILNPKSFSCPYHQHQEEEELFIILKGSGTVRQDNEFYKVKEGDLVFFKTGVAHQFYNHTDSPMLFFALSNQSNKEVCIYPDSNKILEKDGNKRVITKNGIKIDDYWRDEEDPTTKWPSHILQDETST
ncbi:MAG: cupin domain-containing protein [Legionellaceae bacterium]|nr:cupin domain-containing protein [Legionellaceae bacterium]